MDERVQRALERWPNVPDVYGWLSLDRRGRWRLDGGIVRNHNTREAIDRNYACDDRGRWYYQNGPQRVFACLEYTPWIHTIDGASELRTHTGLKVNRLKGVWVDECWSLLLHTEHGIGAVADNDAEQLLDRFCDSAGTLLDVDAVERRLTASPAMMTHLNLFLSWQGRHPVERILSTEVRVRFGFDPAPAAP